MTTRSSSPRLDTIVTRQRSSRIRDIAFALLVVAAGAVSLSTVSYAAHAANQSDVAKR
ncbi:MAG TPA: hypothetical protein VMZ53_14540 [Kofleriaceae bacterium]|nr:hypothetical protein [Kofleriaceae bacterium]